MDRDRGENVGKAKQRGCLGIRLKEVDNKFSCVIIGAGTLPIRCAEILLRAGHEVYSMVSADPEVRKWSACEKITSIVPGDDLAEQIQRPFDYLFSIVNEHILDERVLSLPRKLAINYHDGPLPRYAGTHATSWALMNGETEHGISWHVITDLVDGGDILKQKLVPIAAHETALTLNTKCYEAASEAFAELLEDISHDRLVRTKQNLEERTFFPRFRRPANGGVISWSSSAAEISATVRALDFGSHPNPLGVAKIILDDNFFAVLAVEISHLESGAAPGTINEIGPDFIRISTSDKDVVLRRHSHLNGEPMSVPDLAARFDLRQGYELTALDRETAMRVEEAVKATCKHEAFWVRKLSALEPAALPLATVASVLPESRSLSPTIPADFVSFSEGSMSSGTLGDHLVAAFGGFLARLTGRASFDLAYRASETDREAEGVDSLFVTEVPVRFDVDHHGTFNELLTTNKQGIESTIRHKTFARDVALRYPQFSSLSETEKRFTLPITVVRGPASLENSVANGNELTFRISEADNECRWIYDAGRFDAENIERLAGNFETFLSGIAAHPERQIAQLPLLNENERDRMLVDWNSGSVDVPVDQCIHHFFEAQVKRTPDAVALIFGDTRLTYRELNLRANRMSRHLQTLGVGPEVMVAVCLERSVEMVVAILGILKAGGAYVPLDPAYPKTRLDHILSDSHAPVLVTRTTAAWELDEYKGTVVDLDRDGAIIERQSDTDPLSAVSTRNLAYVIYTSGSTGKPKGVAIEHRSTATFLSWATSVFSLEQLRRTLASTSVCFDLSVFEMFAPLSCGGAIVLVENILHLPADPAAGEVTLINTVPSAIAELVRIKGIPDSVRTVNLAGEPLKASLVRQIYETGTVREVFDLYGPSEDTTYSTFTLRDTGRATIGRPISSTQAYVLDSHLQPVPVGIPGELYLGGDGLARGYLNQPELTAERFIRHPFSENSSARMYRTGDLVRYLPSGEIEYLGRIDNQVKIRGFRIELGEIEAVLSSHSAVAETVVVASEDHAGEKRLAAYFVLADAATAAVADLREHLKQRLPDFMVPSAFVQLDELPLTPNGKVDRKALPEPSSASAELSAAFVAHRDDLESKLVRIWEEILDIRPIGINDNFFELGGHSLKAIRMFAEIEEVFGKNIPLATLFEAGTVEKLAAILRQDGWSAPESSLVPIQPNGTRPPFFCIHAKGGNVLFYRGLAKYLGDDQPFYGLQARRLAGRQIGHASVEEMAEFYIREIQALQPDGPYYVGGSSFGGLVAFEIAQQLRRQGDRVALIALLDTGTPDYPKMLPSTTALRSKAFQLIRRAQHHKASLMAFTAKERSDYIVARLKKVKLKYRRKIRDTYKRAVRKFYSATRGTNSIPTSYIQIEDLIWRAGQKYRPGVYRGDVTLFRASIQPLGIYSDPTLGWAPFIDGELEIHEVPGHHGSIVAEPYVRILADKLRDRLESAQRNEPELVAEVPQAEPRPRDVFRKAAAGNVPGNDPGPSRANAIAAITQSVERM